MEPDVSDHPILFGESKLMIQLSLSGIFSYLATTTKLSENMFDWKGMIKEARDRQKIILKTFQRM